MKLLRMSVVTALRALRRNKLRSGLTILGIVIGVGAVITTVGIGQGASRAVDAEIRSLGKNLLIVVPGARTSRGASSGWGGVATLTVRDAEAIRREASAANDVTYLRSRPVQVVYGGENWATQAQGTTRSYQHIFELELAGGSFFDEGDEATAARVVVVGQTIADELFASGEDPVGATVRIRDVPFVVVGVLASKGQSSLGRDRDDILLMPFATAERRVIGSQIAGLVEQIVVSSVSEAQVELAQRQIEDILRDRHRLDGDEDADFTVRSLKEVAAVAFWGRSSGSRRPAWWRSQSAGHSSFRRTPCSAPSCSPRQSGSSSASIPPGRPHSSIRSRRCATSRLPPTPACAHSPTRTGWCS